MSQRAIWIMLICAAVLIFSAVSCASAPQKEEKEMTKSDTTKTIVEIKTNQGTIELELWPDMAPKTVANFVKLGKEGFYEDTYFHRVIPDFMIQGGDPNTKDKDRSNDGAGGPGYKFEDECYNPGEPISGAITDERMAMDIWQSIIVPYLQKTPTPNAEIKAVVDAVQSKQSGAPIMEKTVEFFLEKTGTPGPYTKKTVKHPVAYGTICMANSGPNTNGSQFFIVTKKEGASWLDGKHTVFGKVTKGMDVVHKIENLQRDGKDNPLESNPATVQKVTVK